MKRQYEVPENDTQREDDSFKLCFCTMLVFLALMVLTCVCFWPRNMVEKKVSYSNTVYDSWSVHLNKQDKTDHVGSSTEKAIKSTESELTSSSLSNSRNTVLKLEKQATDKSTNAQFTSTTEIPETIMINNDATNSLLLESEFTHSNPTSVHLVSEIDETFHDGEETLETAKNPGTTLESTSSLGLSSLLENIDFSTIPDSSENTIPHSSSSIAINEISSTIEDFKSESNEDISTLGSVSEVHTKQTHLMVVTTEVSVSISSSTEEIREPTRTFSSHTDDDTTETEDFHIGLVPNTTEEAFSDSLGSDLVLENSTSHAILSSTSETSTENLDYLSSSTVYALNSERSSSNSRDLNGFEDVVHEISTTESSCLKCPVPVCPVCLVQACSSNEVTPALVGRTCKTSQCHVVASRLLSLVDVSVDPCEDFYSYACGGVLHNPLLLEDDPSLDVWNRIEKAVKNISDASQSSHQKLKNYYDGCVEYGKLLSLEERKIQGRQVLESIGQFYDASTTPEDNLTELLIRLFKLGSGPLFSIGLDVDPTNSSQFQVVVSLPNRLSSLFLSPADRDSRCRHEADDDIPLNLTEAYEMHQNCMNNFSEVLDVTHEALEFFQLFDNDSSQLIQEILMSVEQDLLELLKGLRPPNVAQKDIQTKTYSLLSTDQLESEIPQISWGYLFSTLFNVEFDDTTGVQVYFMDSIKGLFTQLQNQSSRSIHNSLLAVFAHDLYSDIVQVKNPFNRERYCLHVTASLQPIITSNLYLSTFSPHVDQALRQQVMLIYQQLVSAMESRISAAAWLDERSFNELMKKLRLMSIQLPNMFSDLEVAASLGKCDMGNKQYLEDSLCLLQQLQSQMFSLYSLDPHDTEAMWPYFLTSFSTKPLFIYGLNTFLIPHTVVAPVYDKEMPKHVVMAQLGNILARGIGHNFDLTGIKFSESGNVGKTLSEATQHTYKNVVDSSNLQFNWTKSFKEEDRTYIYLLNPKLSLNERLSDITAANLSLSLLSELDVEDSNLPWTPFSPKQVYFLILAQSFCSKKKVPEVFSSLYEGAGLLPYDRVFNLAANSEQFAEVFHCPQGSNMNMHSELKTRPFPLFEKEELYMDTS